MGTHVRKQLDETKEDRENRKLLIEAYKQQSASMKEKHAQRQRSEKQHGKVIYNAINDYIDTFLTGSTADEVLHKYQRRMQRELQWTVLKAQPLALGISAGCYIFTRSMKSYRQGHFIYYIMPYLTMTFFFVNSKKTSLFEIGYPAHPKVLEARQKAVNRSCFGHPKLLKNEIEYLHQKIHDFPEEPDNDLLV